MKKQLSKKLYAFIVIAMMFSATTNAQFESKGTNEKNAEPKTQKQPQPEQKAFGSQCHCHLGHYTYGCGANPWCKLGCVAYCRTHPNQINSESNLALIEFYVEEPGKVSLKIYDLTGRLVTTLADNSFEQGEHSLSWNIKDEKENSVAPGVYSLRMNAGENSETEKLIVMN